MSLQLNVGFLSFEVQHSAYLAKKSDSGAFGRNHERADLPGLGFFDDHDLVMESKPSRMCATFLHRFLHQCAPAILHRDSTFHTCNARPFVLRISRLLLFTFFLAGPSWD